MSFERAKSFLDRWVSDNIHNAVCPKSAAEATHLAGRCLEQAQTEGLTKAELEAAAGEDLVTCMMDAQVASAEAKITDLIEGAE